MIFIVQVPEVHMSQMRIEAESAEQALELVRDGSGDEIDVQYSYTLDHIEWPEPVILDS